VRENILVAAESHHRTGRHGTGHHRASRRQDRRSGVAPADLTDAILDWTGLRPVAGTRADQLPTGTARLVELARTLATRPRVLLLDEPSSGLSAAETGQLAALLRRVSATGVAILLVEHDMSFIMDLCSRVFVLDAGEIIAQGSPAQVQANPEVLKAYLGDTAHLDDTAHLGDTASPGDAAASIAPAASVTEPAPAPSPAAAGTAGEPAPALDLSNVSAGYGGITAVFDVDLTLRRGEVCALLGPNGAGKSTILKVASGQLRPSAGTVSVAGRPIDGLTADRIVRGGLGVVPEGRGVFPNLTVAENLTMATYAGARRESIAEAGYERFPVLSQRRRQLAGTLSGGEQQMLAIARVLAANPSVLLLDELSMGLAPRIVGELYEVIGSIAAGGLSILVVEQFAHEVLRVADTAAVLINGRIAHQGTPSAIDGVLRSAYLAGAREEA
jgi:ABC-type branched-subunit amino acid transport system ATPase component